MEIRDLERSNSEDASIESQRELESRRLPLRQARQWADQAQQERIKLCGDLEMRNCLHQESYARGCQEIEELKRRCYKEENAATQQKLDEHSVQLGRESQTVSPLRDQVTRLQEQLEFIKDVKKFHDLDSRAVPTFRINFLSLRVPKESRATFDCCEIHQKVRVLLETF